MNFCFVYINCYHSNSNIHQPPITSSKRCKAYIHNLNLFELFWPWAILLSGFIANRIRYLLTQAEADNYMYICMYYIYIGVFQKQIKISCV